MHVLKALNKNSRALETQLCQNESFPLYHFQKIGNLQLASYNWQFASGNLQVAIGNTQLAIRNWQFTI